MPTIYEGEVAGGHDSRFGVPVARLAHILHPAQPLSTLCRHNALRILDTPCHTCNAASRLDCI
jgi:hypothetical protein